jgi:crotonobetainyl-CoA:carnitine CoA-transferase CaiB-like acyl-CoA transferase
MDETAPMLAGIVVLDLTRVLAGPYCTRLLADLGARVIKVERPGEGDFMRRAHFQLEPGRDDQSTYFTRVNAGKESVAIDLARPEGREVLLDLARLADVLVENFAPGVAARLGCDHRAVARVRPDVVYCSISGYGQTGPWRERVAFAHVIHAVSGLMHLEQGDESAPMGANLQAADVLAGTHAFGLILAALWRRARTGAGACLDVSMLQALIGADDASFGAVLNGGPEMGAPRPGMMVHALAGRHVALQIVGAPELWPRLAGLMQRPDLAVDPRFATPTARRENWRPLREIIAAWLDQTFSSAEAALTALGAARIPCAPVLRPAEVVALPQLAERRAFPAVPHPARGQVRVTASPYHVDGQPVLPAGPAPYRIGEHTRAVLAGLLDYPAARIEALATAGVIGLP